jgi:hypothetical protein
MLVHGHFMSANASLALVRHMRPILECVDLSRQISSSSSIGQVSLTLAAEEVNHSIGSRLLADLGLSNWKRSSLTLKDQVGREVPRGTSASNDKTAVKKSLKL